MMLTAYLGTLAAVMQQTEVTLRDSEVVALDKGAAQAGALILAVRAAGGKILLVGNGGSAAIASHMQNDLCKAVGVRAMVLTETPLLTALANDISYLAAYEKLIELWAEKNDLLIAISSSGRSENILRSVKAMRDKGGHIITLSGFRPDNALRQRGEVNFYVPSEVYSYVELAHQIIAHFLTDSVRGDLPAIR